MPAINVSGGGGGIGIGGAVFLFLVLMFAILVVVIKLKFQSVWSWITGIGQVFVGGVFKSVELVKKILKKIGCVFLKAMAMSGHPIMAIVYKKTKDKCAKKEVPFLAFVQKAYEIVENSYKSQKIEGKNLNADQTAANATLDVFLKGYAKDRVEAYDTFKNKVYNYEHKYKDILGNSVSRKMDLATVVGFCDDMMDFDFGEKLTKQLDTNNDGIVSASEKVDLSSKKKVMKLVKEDYILKTMTETPENWMEFDPVLKAKQVVNWVSDPGRQADIMKKQEYLDVLFGQIAKEPD
eukprot:jgi/Mesvir1/1536/Mv14519-RA.1